MEEMNYALVVAVRNLKIVVEEKHKQVSSFVISSKEFEK
jgi:hypothetical protein